MPTYGGGTITRFLAVVREQRGLLVEMLGVPLLDRTRDGGMYNAAAFPQLAAKRYLLG